MKKIMMITGMACMISSAAIAQIVQAPIRETRMSIDGADRPAYNMEFPYDSKLIQDAWNAKMDDLKLKGKSSKGVTVYEGVKVLDIYYEAIDIFVKIEKVDKTKSHLTLTASKGYGNFITDADTKIVEGIKHFMTLFVDYVDQYKLKLDIKDHEDLIRTTQKDHQKLIDDGKKLQEQIDRNKIEQENKLKEIEGHNQKLEGMKGKIKL